MNGTTKEANHYYSTDVWGLVAKELEGSLPAGYTVYAEIVGFTDDDSPIQGGYAYGCGYKQHKLVAYRVTSTNVDGIPIELSWPQMLEFCEKYGIGVVPTLYYGKAVDLFPDTNLPDVQLWQDSFLKFLEWKYANDGGCIYNAPKTPAEGVVVRVDHLNGADAYKLKNFRFLESESKQLDKGTLDMETEQSEVEVAA